MKKSTLQFWTTVVLLAIPVLMIWFNGTKALNAILWNKPTQGTIGQIAQTKNHEKQALNFGIYDPYNSCSDSSISWEYSQLYITWLNFDRQMIEQKIKGIQQQGTKVILIIEPWAKLETPLFDDIVAGQYDTEINSIESLLKDVKDTVYVAWGHEMDQDLTTRYDWSSNNTEGYKAAYKYVHTKLNTAKIKWIWAPVGKNNCNDYWPGDAYVNMIGLPIYSFPDFDYKYYGKIRSFEEAFDEKYELVENHNKPIFLIEFGVSGSEDYKAYWLREAFKSFRKFELLKLVVFFNSKDTEGVWGDQYKTPDWTVNQELLSAYIKTYKQLE